MPGLGASLTDPYNYGFGCVLDGVPTACSQALRMLNNGSAAQCPNNNCGPRHNGRGWEFWNPSTGWLASNARKRNPPKLKFLTPYDRAERKRIKKEGGLNPFGIGDDENTSFDLSTITTLVSTALAKPECIDFYTTVLSGVSNKRNPVLHSGSLQNIFAAFLAQKNGGFTRQQPSNATGPANAYAFGIVGSTNGAGIYLQEKTQPDQTFWDAYFTVGELFHLAGSKGNRSGGPAFAYSNLTEGIVYRVDESDDEIIGIEYLPSAQDCRAVINSQAIQRNVWRGLVPLRSTQKDVERLLGVAQVSSGSIHIYRANSEAISIRYVSQNCDSGGGYWNVPVDTVEEIEVSAMTTLLPRDLNLDLSEYEKVESPHPENVFYYRNADDGVFIRTKFRGNCEEVTSVTYGPATKDKSLRCPNLPKQKPVTQ